MTGATRDDVLFVWLTLGNNLTPIDKSFEHDGEHDKLIQDHIGHLCLTLDHALHTLLETGTVCLGPALLRCGVCYRYEKKKYNTLSENPVGFANNEVCNFLKVI